MENNRTSEQTQQICPFCRDQLQDQIRLACATCETRQHMECALEHGRCVTHGCASMDFINLDSESAQPVNIAYLDCHASSWEEILSGFDKDREWEQARKRVFVSESLTTKVPRWGLTSLLALVVSVSLMKTLVSGGLLLFLLFAGPISLVTLLALKWIRRRYKARIETWSATDVSGVSYWHDVLGNTGFDPLMGMGPPPSVEPDDGRGTGAV